MYQRFVLFMYKALLTSIDKHHDPFVYDYSLIPTQKSISRSSWLYSKLTSIKYVKPSYKFRSTFLSHSYIEPSYDSCMER